MELGVTVDEIMEWVPCPEYTRERISGLFAGRERMTALEILDLQISAVDRLWAVLREQLITARELHELACRFAEHALENERAAGREPDPRSWAGIEAKRAWLRGEIDDEALKAASAAAWAARHAAFSAVSASKVAVSASKVAVSAREAAFSAVSASKVAVLVREVAILAREAGSAADEGNYADYQIGITREMVHERR